MLDPQLDAPARDGLARRRTGQIEASGALKHENSWGLRKMAYEINKRTEADYRWFRFEAPSELLDSLDHNLKIADGVLRFRIFKVDPDAPVIVPPAVSRRPRAARAQRDGSPRRPRRLRRRRRRVARSGTRSLRGMSLSEGERSRRRRS